MRLAIPKRIDISALGKLSSQHGRSGRLLIDAKLVERSPPLIEQVDLLYQLQIQPTEWRSLVPAYIRLVHRSLRSIGALFFQDEAENSLHAREKDGPLFSSVFVVQS